MPSLSPHISSVPESGIRRIFEIAVELDDVILLALGEPDLPVAPHILAAGSRAWLADQTNYTANGGIPQLREAIVKKLARENDLHVQTEQVWVTVGGAQGLHQAMRLVLGAGDEVLLPDPGYSTFVMSARMLEASPVPYTLRPERGFGPDLDELETIVTPKTRAIIVNSPSNPLGVVYSREQLQSLVDFAKRHDLWILSDEVYEYFTFGTEPSNSGHVSIASLDTDDRVFSIFSLSKTYAMTGARVGYLVTPPGFTAVMRTVQEATISCVAMPDQYAAVAAITGDHQHVADAREHYRSNLEAACALLDAKNIPYLRPTGAFYLWVDLRHATSGDVAVWAEHFLLTERVAVAPGSAFGRSGEGWIRISLTASEADLLAGLARLPSPVA
ncbi:pyridoxal phosphate-dependent aminotransferase [soil metagenome]